MKTLFNKPETIIHVNEFEQIRVTGDYDNYHYDLYIFSEKFQTWLKQDFEVLKVYASVIDQLALDIEQHLIKEGKFDEQYHAV